MGIILQVLCLFGKLTPTTLDRCLSKLKGLLRNYRRILKVSFGSTHPSFQHPFFNMRKDLLIGGAKEGLATEVAQFEETFVEAAASLKFT